MEKLKYSYNFINNEGKSKTFDITLYKKSLNLKPKKYDDPPKWTKLKFHRCPNCKLNETQNPHCPVAVNMSDIVEYFRSSSSFEDADITIKTPARTYSKATSLQQGVSSILGIIMATSCCPTLDKLKQLVRFHLPFASQQETLYRTMSSYLLKQYFLMKDRKEPDWELNGLVKYYQDVHKINLAFFDRLKQIKGMDTNVNALLILDNFANYVNFTLNSDKIKKLKTLFTDLD